MEPPTQQSIDPQQSVLSQLLVAQSILHVYASREKVAEIVSNLVLSIPGVKASAICIRGLDKIIGKIGCIKCQECDKPSARSDSMLHFECRLTTDPKFRIFSLETSSFLYGYLILETEDYLHLEAHESALKNFASSVAVTLENIWQKEELESANERLERYGRDLEDLIQARTSELENTNEKLRIEIAKKTTVEDALRVSEKRYRSIVENSPMGMLVYRLEDNGRLVLEAANPAANRFTGVDNSQRIGMTIEQAYPALADTEIPNAYRKAASSGINWHSESVTYDDQEIQGAYDVYAFQSSPQKVTVLFLNITERKLLEELMIQSEKMLSVGGLAAGMAHEINNPLAGILQSTQVVLDRLFENLPANEQAAKEIGVELDLIRKYMEKRQVSKMLKAIQTSGQRAANIVENMLQFSRKGKGDFSEQDLYELADQTLELAASDYDLKKKYDFRKIRIVRDYQNDLPLIKCHKTRLQQVILNLLKNGAEAMIENQDPSYQPRFNISIRRDRDMALFQLQDNGPGMPEEVRRRVFEPFFTTRDVGGGIGLGLSVSYFIITENHGGTMTVDSAPGKGTSFTIKLPIMEKAQ